MDFLANLLGKLLSSVLRVLGSGGSALPGLFVEKIDHKFMDRKLRQLPEGVVVVSGTNGKTTTTKLVAAGLRAHGLRVLTNPTGSNFVRGVISLIVQKTTITGKLPYDVAVLELDEAYGAKFVKWHQPQAVLVLNVMRDQMDRFGEIDKTAKFLGDITAAARELVVLNGDDPRVSNLSHKSGTEAVYFGIDSKLRQLFPQDDELHGGRVQTNRPALSAKLLSFNKGSIKMEIDGVTYNHKLKVSGNHNALNTVAAALIIHQLGYNDDPLTLDALAKTKPAFGRGEKLERGGRKIILQLVKNPSGFRHAIKLTDTLKPKAVLIAINDDYADGRDVSWLWDVDFRGLKDHQPVSTSGQRAKDMALRLKYDGIEAVESNDNLWRSLDNAIRQTPEGATLSVFCTYTAMLRLRERLVGHQLEDA